MSVQVSSLIVGDVLYQMGTALMGNTRSRRDVVHVGKVIDVGVDPKLGRYAVIKSRYSERYHYGTAPWRRSPKEWIRSSWSGRTCAICHADRVNGHRFTCEHPAAVRARKKAEAKGMKR